MAKLQMPAEADRIIADEEMFLDRSATRFVMVEDSESILPWVKQEPSPDSFKILALLARKPGMSLSDFIEYYDTKHAPLGIKTQTIMTRYMRHYLHPIRYPLTGTEQQEAEYDVVTEI